MLANKFFLNFEAANLFAHKLILSKLMHLRMVFIHKDNDFSINDLLL